MNTIKCANPTCNNIVLTNNNKRFYCNFGCSGKAYKYKREQPQEYCNSYAIYKKEGNDKVGMDHDFKSKFISSLHSYSDTTNYKRGKINPTTKYIIDFLQHLKADLGEVLSNENTKLNINVFYVKDGLFAEIALREHYLRFYRDKNKIKIISNDYFLDIYENFTLMDYQIHTLKEMPLNIDEMMSIYLELAFKDKCIVEMNGAE